MMKQCHNKNQNSTLRTPDWLNHLYLQTTTTKWLNSRVKQIKMSIQRLAILLSIWLDLKTMEMERRLFQFHIEWWQEDKSEMWLWRFIHYSYDATRYPDPNKESISISILWWFYSWIQIPWQEQHSPIWDWIYYFWVLNDWSGDWRERTDHRSQSQVIW